MQQSFPDEPPTQDAERTKGNRADDASMSHARHIEVTERHDALQE